jgi:hypothetical protein
VDIKDWGVVIALCLSAASLYITLRRDRENREINLVQKRLRAKKQVVLALSSSKRLRMQMVAMANEDERHAEACRRIFENAAETIRQLEDISAELDKLPEKPGSAHEKALMLEEVVGRGDIVLDSSIEIEREIMQTITDMKEQKERV